MSSTTTVRPSGLILPAGVKVDESKSGEGLVSREDFEQEIRVNPRKSALQATKMLHHFLAQKDLEHAAYAVVVIDCCGYGDKLQVDLKPDAKNARDHRLFIQQVMLRAKELHQGLDPAAKAVTAIAKLRQSYMEAHHKAGLVTDPAKVNAMREATLDKRTELALQRMKKGTSSKRSLRRYGRKRKRR